MFIVDNFRMILLVGLICRGGGGVPPTTALRCIGFPSSFKYDCKAGQVCGRGFVDTGCMNPSACPIEECKDFGSVKDGPSTKICCNSDMCNSLELEDGSKYGYDICTAPGVMETIDKHACKKLEAAGYPGSIPGVRDKISKACAPPTTPTPDDPMTTTMDPGNPTPTTPSGHQKSSTTRKTNKGEGGGWSGAEGGLSQKSYYGGFPLATLLAGSVSLFLLKTVLWS